MTSPWVAVDPQRDFTAQVLLEDLRPGAEYQADVEGRSAGGGAARVPGRFRTAPAADESEAVSFVVTTCHSFATVMDTGQGPAIYESMLSLDPEFLVHAGDLVYYDRDTPPLATNAELARVHWQRLYSLPRHRRFHRQVGAYFIKDDHDLLKDDCWPGLSYGDLTFEVGAELFREQTPHGPLPYRTRRWGKHLQVWIVEGREYRSPNNMPDGPDKTIWGDEQMRWLREGMTASDATFKVLLSATPIIGPDRDNKHDNHANANFKHEGDLVREFLADLGNTWIVCGDRHWQYISEAPNTKLREYACGPSTNSHAGGWNPYGWRQGHRFLRVLGGFLSVSVEPDDGDRPPRIAFRHHNMQGKVVNEELHEG